MNNWFKVAAGLVGYVFLAWIVMMICMILHISGVAFTGQVVPMPLQVMVILEVACAPLALICMGIGVWKATTSET